MGAREAAELVQKYRRGLTQTALAHELSQALGRHITQGQVSQHLKGVRWSDPDLPGAYVKVLGIPGDEMAAAFGFTVERGPRPPTLEDVVKADPTLSKEAKRHIISQYRMLQRATQADRAGLPEPTPKGRSKRTSA